jgi:hypothetical protein
VEIVVVEVNGAVLLGRAPPVHLASVPVVTGHRALGRVHRTAVPRVRRPVGHAIARDVGGQVPDGDGPLVLRHARAVDLPVEVPHGAQPPVLHPAPGGGEKEGAARGRRHGREARRHGDGPLGAGCVLDERRLAERDGPGGEVHIGAHPIPAPRGEGRGGGGSRGLAAPARAGQEGQRARLVEQEGESPRARPRPTCP